MKCAKCGWSIPEKFQGAFCALCIWRLEVQRYAEAFQNSAAYIELKKNFVPLATVRG